jgi:hypothetical protein
MSQSNQQSGSTGAAVRPGLSGTLKIIDIGGAE